MLTRILSTAVLFLSLSLSNGIANTSENFGDWSTQNPAIRVQDPEIRFTPNKKTKIILSTLSQTIFIEGIANEEDQLEMIEMILDPTYLAPRIFPFTSNLDSTQPVIYKQAFNGKKPILNIFYSRSLKKETNKTTYLFKMSRKERLSFEGKFADKSMKKSEYFATISRTSTNAIAITIQMAETNKHPGGVTIIKLPWKKFIRQVETDSSKHFAKALRAVAEQLHEDIQ